MIFKNKASWYAKCAFIVSLHSILPVTYTQETIPTPAQTAEALYNIVEHPTQFLFGVSTSTHQCSDQCNKTGKMLGKHICDWSAFAIEKKLKTTQNEHDYPANIMINGTTYIDQLKEKLGINSLRISIEWALIQPEGPDTYCSATLKQYATLFTHMIKQGITPIICFHHYTSPCWFANRNGFEDIKNIPLFSHYCCLVYTHLMTAVLNDPEALFMLKNELEKNNRPPLWATFNSPEGVAFKGYKTNEAPPSNPKKNSLSWVARVLKNMLEAHVHTYFALKTTHTINSELSTTLPLPRIGFLKNITQLDIAQKNLLHSILWPLTKICCMVGEDLQSNCIYRFFTTGKFAITLPGIITPHINPQAPYALDWIGVNYYSNQLLTLSSRVTENNTNANGTDNSNYRIYPHGLYRAIKEIHTKLIIPLAITRNSTPIPAYVTENGIATANEEKRSRFYAAYINELTKAIQDGYPVQGYLIWTAFDNYEWPKPQEKNPIKRNYGLCTVSSNGKTLTVKPGAYYYRDVIASFIK